MAWTDYLPAGMLSNGLALTPEGAFDPQRPIDPRSSMLVNMGYQAGMLPKRLIDAAKAVPPGTPYEQMSPEEQAAFHDLVGASTETAMTAGLGATPAAEAGAVGAFGGRAAYNPLVDREAMGVAQERAIARRGEGLATGKSAPGWDFKRPDPTGFAKDAADARAGFKSDAADAKADYLDWTNPNLTADDRAHLEEMAQVPSDIGTQKGFTLGSGATDKRMAAAEAMMAAHDPRLQQAYRDEMGVTQGDAAYKAYLALHGEPHVAETAAAERAAPRAAEAAPAEPAGGPGAGGGAGGLEQAQATAARWAGAAKPLEGLPQKPMLINGEHFVPGPIGSVRDVAEDYMRSTGRPYEPPTQYHPLDPEHSEAIAQAFEDMPHTPDDPATKASYGALAKETLAQYQAMKKAGLKTEFIPPDMPDPYAANPRLAAKDVAENNHLWVFPTDQGFGSAGPMGGAHPMLQPTGETISGKPAVLNDIFRAVHDYFGHLKEGHGFRAGGEDNAWRSHAAMYSDIARPAMTTETRGQNSWVNYGPHGEANRTASAADTKYADQKVGLMPEWTMRDRGSPDPIMAYHGSPHDIEKFDISKVGTGEGNQAYGHGMYFAETPAVANWYRQQLTARRDSELLKKYGLDSEDGAQLGIRLAARGGDVNKVISYHQKQLETEQRLRELGDTSAATRNAIKRNEGMVNYLKDPNRAIGHEYEVRINAQPEDFLDWDNPPTPQTLEKVKKAAGDIKPNVYERVMGVGKELPRWAMTQDDLVKARTGEELHAMLNRGFRDPAGASRALSKAGIKGIRYLDQGSRSSGGSSNYVVFDPKIVAIIRKYGLAGLLPAGGAAASFGALGRPQEQ